MRLCNFRSKFLIRILLPLVAFLLLTTPSSAQTSPVGWMDMDATLRNLQLLGQLDPNISFSVRPVHYKPGIAKRNTTGATIQDIFNDMDSSGKLFRSIHFDDNKGVIRILPTQFTFKNNSHHPFGWNDEAMIAAKGVQTVVSAGVYSRYGPVSVQFQPQWVRSQNAQFENNASYGATVSGLQEKFLLGQSSALLHVGGFAAGLSTQNLLLGAYHEKAKAERDKSLQDVYNFFPKLKDRSSQIANTMSGGEQQMLAIGRGLMGMPKLLMVDEPFLGLAPLVIEDLKLIFKKIAARGISILFVEQNVRLALSMAQRGYVLESGRLIIEGVSNDLINSKELKRVFLGS